MGLIEWWSELPAFLRYGVSIGFLLLSTALLLFAHLFWPYGWAIGIVLLLFSGRSSSDKGGYNF